MNDFHPAGIENLRTAIITRAMDDYERTLNNKPVQYDQRKIGFWKAECENFFRSPWFNFLTGGIDGEKVMEVCHLKAKFSAFREAHECGKCVRECVNRDAGHYTAVERGELHCPGIIRKGERQHETQRFIDDGFCE